MSTGHNTVEIVPFEPSLATSFMEINLEWLNSYYHATPEDLVILEHPEEIIEAGGLILFARVGDKIVGTAALNKVSDEVVELIKMGVTSKMQGLGIGRKLMDAVILEATNMKAKKIELETATQLTAAVALYTNSGFVKISEEEVHPRFGRVTFKMEKVL